jgi:hypothetical protein
MPYRIVRKCYARYNRAHNNIHKDAGISDDNPDVSPFVRQQFWQRKSSYLAIASTESEESMSGNRLIN